jgi:hypothetical protein
MSDWLDLPPANENEVIAAEVNDSVTGAKVGLRKALPDKLSPEGANMVLALRSLSGQQRLLIRALIGAGGALKPALRALRDQFVTVSEHTARSWMREPRFQRALAMSREFAAKQAGVDPASLILKTAAIIEDAMTPRQTYDEDGRPLTDPEMNHNAALRGIELMAKVHGMTREADTTRVTLEIVNIANRDEIDVVAEQ